MIIESARISSILYSAQDSQVGFFGLENTAHQLCKCTVEPRVFVICLKELSQDTKDSWMQRDHMVVPTINNCTVGDTASESHYHRFGPFPVRFIRFRRQI